MSGAPAPAAAVRRLLLAFALSAAACLVLGSSIHTNASSSSLGSTGGDISAYFVINFCTGTFSGKGGLIRVTAPSGAHHVVGTWDWPFSGGCKVQASPHISHTPDTVILHWGTEFGTIVEVHKSGKIVRVTRPQADRLFPGFIAATAVSSPSRALREERRLSAGHQDALMLLGTSPTVDRDGFCSNGCFGFWALDASSGVTARLQALPWRAAMSDAHYFDRQSGLYYYSASYPLTPDWVCSSTLSDSCLLAVNASTGAIVNSAGPLAFTPYNYAPQQPSTRGLLRSSASSAGSDSAARRRDSSSSSSSSSASTLAFVRGFPQECPHDRGVTNYAFIELDLDRANARKLVSCAPPSLTVQMKPWTSRFSADRRFFAQASGNPYAGRMQFVVLRVDSGEAVLNTPLTELLETLGVPDEMPFVNVWGVSFFDE